jgi:hypothetical protein
MVVKICLEIGANDPERIKKGNLKVKNALFYFLELK